MHDKITCNEPIVIVNANHMFIKRSKEYILEKQIP